MSCKVKQQALSVMEKEGAIKNNVVIDFRTFDKLNDEFTRTAVNKYNVGTGNTPLFSVSMDTDKLEVIPNDMLLDSLDRAIEHYNGIYNYDPVNERIRVAYNTFPELKDAGTLLEYNEYLKSIFPNSEVKEPLFHGSPNTFEEFDLNRNGERTGQGSPGIYFTDSFKTAEWYADGDIEHDQFESQEEYNAIKQSKVYMVMINAEEIELVDNPQGLNPDGEKVFRTKEKMSDIGFMNSAMKDMAHQYIVFNTNQIHILGNKKDIEAFKEYKAKNIFESKLQKLADDSQTPMFEYVDVEAQPEQDVPVDNTAINKSILFGGNKAPNTAAEVIQNIVANFPAINDNTRFLLEKVIPLLGKSKATVRIVKKSALKNSDTLMQYDVSNNEIQLSLETLADASPEYAVQSFLHEVVHSVTLQAYLNPQTIEQKMFRQFIDKKFGEYSELSDSYGLTNPAEFIAEIISNRAFQNEFKALEASNKGFWDQLIDFIRMLFGVRKTSDFNNIVDSITSIVSDHQGNFEGMGGRSNIFEFKQSENEPNIPSLKTLEDKVNKLVTDAIDNIEQAAKRVRIKGKKGDAKNNAMEFKSDLEDLKLGMERLAEKEQFKSIILYVKSLKGTVNILKKKVEEANRDGARIVETMNHYEDYLAAYDLLDDINALVDEALESEDITDDELNDVKEIDNILSTFAKDHRRLIGRMSTIKKKAITKVMATIDNFPEVEYEWKTKLEAEYDPDLAKGLSKAEWVTQQMIGPRAEEIQEDVNKAALSAAEDIDEDITSAEANLSDPLNANGSRLFKLAVNIVAQMRNRIIQKIHDFEFELDEIFSRLSKGAKSMVPSKRYKNMLDTDIDGNYYLAGKYKTTFLDALAERNEIKANIKELRADAEGMGWSNAEIMAAEDYREAVDRLRAWEKKHTKVVKGTRVPNDSYLNPEYEKLSEVEKEFIDKFKEINRLNEAKFGKYASLRIKEFGVEFHRLPAVSKSNHERTIEKDFKGALKDNWKDATQIRTDDVGYQEEALDGKNQPLKDIRVHYRGKIDPNEQSLDLPTLLRMEYHNGVNYDEKQKAKMVLNEIAEMARKKKYIATSQRTGNWLINLFRKNKDVATVTGENSVTYKRLKSYIDTNIYDILNVHAGFTLAGADVNKIVKTVNGYTATLGMALNVASASVNVLNGFSQMYIESFGGNHISFKSLQKAEGMYFRDMGNVLADLGRPVKKSVTNQINQMFDTFGGFSIANQEFFKNTIAKRLASSEILSGLQDGGEHMMQSILTMAVLDGIKVMNKDGKFIDKNGNTTDEKGAASLLDMIKIDENQQAYVSGKVYYTTHTRNIDFHEGGQAHVSLLIKKKIEDTAGVYDSNMQPEIYRHWYGKLVLLFKRFLISQMQNRWVGISTVHKKKSELTKRDRQFNIATKEYIEGTHVTALRLIVGNPAETWRTFMQDGVVAALKSLKLAHMKENYSQLTDYEKANLKKATADVVTTAILLPLLVAIASAAAEDDDEPYLWYLTYLARRLESELSQFRNPREAWRITSNPVAGTRIIQNALTVIGDVLSPWDYLDTDSKGNNIMLKDAEKMIPVWIQFKKEWKQSYHFIQNQAN